jgi:putative transposase
LQRTHKIRLNPTPEQEVYFRKACGTARFAFNWGLARWKRHKQEHPGEPYGAMAIKKEFQAIRREQFPWTLEVTKSVIEGAFAQLGRALQNYYASKNGERKGKRMGFPKFKRKKNARQSFYLAHDRFNVDDHTVTISKLGPVNTAEELRFSGKVVNGTVVREADGHWYIAITVKLEAPLHNDKAEGLVGVDVGIKALAVLSTGERYENQEPLRSELTHLKRLNRRLSRRKPGSNRWQKAKLALGRFHSRIAARRNDHLHKVTTAVTRRYDTVVLEDLNVAGMLRNHCLALSLSDAAFGELHRQFGYKANRVLKVERFFPSSRLCEECGAINWALTLADRVFICPACGHTEDRDWHASKNLALEGWRLAFNQPPSGSGYDGRMGRGQDVRPFSGAVLGEASTSMVSTFAY